jgi:hypothetical protein
MDNEALLLAFIQESVRAGRFFITSHAVSRHPIEEGFTVRQALDSIINGQIIENRRSESRCLISGRAAKLEAKPRFVENYIHCICRYDDISRIVIIAMYRPGVDHWINDDTRT